MRFNANIMVINDVRIHHGSKFFIVKVFPCLLEDWSLFGLCSLNPIFKIKNMDIPIEKDPK